MGQKTSRGCGGGTGNSARAAMPFQISGWVLRRILGVRRDGRWQAVAQGCRLRLLESLLGGRNSHYSTCIVRLAASCLSTLSAINPALAQKNPSNSPWHHSMMRMSSTLFWWWSDGTASNPVRPWRALLGGRHFDGFDGCLPRDLQMGPTVPPNPAQAPLIPWWQCGLFTPNSKSARLTGKARREPIGLTALVPLSNAGLNKL